MYGIKWYAQSRKRQPWVSSRRETYTISRECKAVLGPTVVSIWVEQPGTKQMNAIVEIWLSNLGGTMLGGAVLVSKRLRESGLLAWPLEPVMAT